MFAHCFKLFYIRQLGAATNCRCNWGGVAVIQTQGGSVYLGVGSDESVEEPRLEDNRPASGSTGEQQTQHVDLQKELWHRCMLGHIGHEATFSLPHLLLRLHLFDSHRSVLWIVLPSDHRTNRSRSGREAKCKPRLPATLPRPCVPPSDSLLVLQPDYDGDAGSAARQAGRRRRCRVFLLLFSPLVPLYRCVAFVPFLHFSFPVCDPLPRFLHLQSQKCRHGSRGTQDVDVVQRKL